MEKDTGHTKAHTIYRVDGKRVPGVTTVTGLLNKPALLHWSWDLGMQKIDYRIFRDEKAAIGKLAHYMVEQYLKKESLDLPDYTPNQVELAEYSFQKYLTWEKGRDFELLGVEMMLTSGKYLYGGQCDIYARVDGRKTLIDLKTSKAVFPEMHTQVIAYKHLLKENGYVVEEVAILRIGRDEGEGWEEITVGNHDLHWEKFKHLLEIYKLNKTLGG